MKGLIFTFAFLLIACNKIHTSKSVSLTNENWVVEQQPGGSVSFDKKKLEINDAKGCTVWYSKKLKAPIQIDYEVEIVDKGGPFDRVSDLNCFWMANDPMYPEHFFRNTLHRKGKFTNYHNLMLYYVGFGGHNNTKTRFRRYNGELNRPLLPEHDLSGETYQIIPNKNIHISIRVDSNGTVYKKDGEIIFQFSDQAPYTSGYFGFRTVNNHMVIKSFKITQL